MKTLRYKCVALLKYSENQVLLNSYRSCLLYFYKN